MTDNGLTWVHCEALQLTRDGDVLLVLDSGEAFPAHAVYLKHTSSVLAEAIAIAAGVPAAGPLPVAVPDTTSEDLLLLLRGIYSQSGTPLEGFRDDWPSLWALARLSDQLGCKQVLQQVDVALVQASCGPASGLCKDNAVACLKDCQRWGLEQMQAHLTEHIIANIRAVHVPAPTGADLSLILKQVAPMCITLAEVHQLRQQLQKARRTTAALKMQYETVVRRVRHVGHQLEVVDFDKGSVTKLGRKRKYLRDCFGSLDRALAEADTACGGDFELGLESSINLLNSMAQ